MAGACCLHRQHPAPCLGHRPGLWPQTADGCEDLLGWPKARIPEERLGIATRYGHVTLSACKGEGARWLRRGRCVTRPLRALRAAAQHDCSPVSTHAENKRSAPYSFDHGCFARFCTHRRVRLKAPLPLMRPPARTCTQRQQRSGCYPYKRCFIPSR